MVKYLISSAGLLRSGPSSPILSRQSSRGSLEMENLTPPPMDMETKVVINEAQFRNIKDIEMRKKMKLNSVHESEEYRQSLNVAKLAEENKVDAIEESSDEIQLDSDASV